MRFIPLFFSLLALTACYQTESSITDSLVYCTDKAPTTFNPQISHDVASLDATTHQLYNRLIKIDPVSQRYVGDIATHWQVNDDKTEFTFYLRRDVNFHDTEYFTPSRHLNADDVIFSFRRMLSKDHPFHAINFAKKGETYLYNHPFANLAGKVVKMDQYTVRFILDKPDVTLLDNLAAHYAVILSKQYALQLLQSGRPKDLDFLPVGTGPYQYQPSQNSNIIRYHAHPHPWQRAANIEHLIYDITPNSSKRYAKLLSGECDIITNPAASQIKTISLNKAVLMSSQPTRNVAMIAFNTKKSQLEQAEIRHALSTAIDMKTIVDAVFFASASASHTLLPDTAWAFNPRTTQSPFSPQTSLTTLREQGYDFNKTLRILAPLKNSVFNPNFYKTAELIQSDLADIGIKSEIVQLRPIELQSALLTGHYDIYLTGISPYISDPDNLFRPLFSCEANQLEGNSSQWCDEFMQRLLNDALLEGHFIQRVKNYYQLQTHIHKQSAYLPLGHLIRFDVFNPNIFKFEVDPLTGINFHHAFKISPLSKELSQ